MTSERSVPDLYRDKTVAITGSSGYIGTALTEALAQTAAHLLLVSRRPAPAGLSGPGTRRCAHG